MSDEWHRGIYETMQSNRILVAFKGPFFQDTLVDLGSFIRGHLCQFRKVNAVFAIFVELSQNIMRYSKDVSQRGGQYGGAGMFCLAEDDNSYLLTAANIIDPQDVEKLQKKCSPLLAMDRDALRAHYKECRKASLPRGSTSAGLGFLEIARHADHPLNFHFEDVQYQKRLFCLTARVNK